MSSTMDGKIALVTGAAAGIGRASAVAFARQGAKVALADVDVSGAQETLGFLKETGGDGIFVKCDVIGGHHIDFC